MFENIFSRPKKEKVEPFYEREDPVFVGLEDYETEGEELVREKFDKTWTSREIERCKKLLESIDLAPLPTPPSDSEEAGMFKKEVEDFRKGDIALYSLDSIFSTDEELRLLDAEQAFEWKKNFSKNLKNALNRLRAGKQPDGSISPEEVTFILKEVAKDRQCMVKMGDYLQERKASGLYYGR